MSPLADVIERAARADIRVRLCADGQVRCSVRPPDELVDELRQHRDELARRIRDWKCCWCLDKARDAWFTDHDSDLPICRKCVQQVGQARLDAEGFDVDRWEQRAKLDNFAADTTNESARAPVVTADDQPDLTVDDLTESGWSPEHFKNGEQVRR